MTIKRTEITVETERLVVISDRRLRQRGWCTLCRRDVALVTVDEAARFLGATSSRVCSRRPSELHVIENGSGDMLICTQSLSSLIQTEPQSNPVPAFEKEINS